METAHEAHGSNNPAFPAASVLEGKSASRENSRPEMAGIYE
jgi:hypothetical protein